MTQSVWDIIRENVQNVALCLLVVIAFVTLRIQLSQLRREKDLNMTVQSVIKNYRRRCDALELRVSALESPSVIAGVTLRNPTPGETP